MNSLVGYGSSDESDSEPETQQPPKQAATKLTNGVDTKTSNGAQASNGAQVSTGPQAPPQPAPSTSSTSTSSSTSTTSSFPPVQDNLDKKLDISDDEDNYIPAKPSSNKPSSTTLPSVTSSIPKPSPQLQNLSEVINKAQIVTVDRENLQSKEGVIASFLPQPKQNTVHELELERLHKSKRRKKDKKKIFVLDLEDFSDEEEVKPKPPRPVSSKSASGLFSILPQPKNCKITTKSTKSVIPDRAKLMKPRTLQPPKVEKKVTEEVELETVEDNDQNGSDFFSFTSYQKSAKEIEKAAKAVKLDQFKPKKVSATPATMAVQGELRSIDAITIPQEQPTIQPELLPPSEDVSEVPAEFRDFVFNSADIVDVNQEIQSTDEWALKNLDYSDDKPQSSGKCPLKGQTRRKNQINYLAWQAKERESDLKKQWGDNRQNRHATQSKYGFR